MGFKETENGECRVEGWKEYKLGELAEISSSKRIYAKEYVEYGIPFYRSKEIIEKSNGNDISTELYISKERFNELKNKFGVPKQGDILLTSVGTLGVPYVVKDEEFYFKDGNLTWLKNFKSDCFNKFIYYWLLSVYGKNQINSRCIGSTQKALTIDTLKKFDITMPLLQEQKFIAHILSTLDEKIEINNQINKKLEEMAQAIFKQWFVDFDFPNEDGEPYKSSGGEMIESEMGMIPKGWEVVELDDVCYFNNNTYSAKDKFSFINYLDTSNITENKVDAIQKIDCNSGKVPSRAKRRVIEDSIVYSTVRPNQLHYGIIKHPVKNMIVSTGFVVIDSKFDYLKSDLIYLWLTQKDVTKKLQAIAETSTSTYPSIKPSDIKSIKIIIPNRRNLDFVSTLFSELYLYIDTLNNENKKLSALRDTLLPKLMSGEIRVPLK